MAETLISPGVLTRENDQSQITSQPIQAGAAIIGPTVKGKVNIPVLVTSYSEYNASFGGAFDSASDSYSFLTSISAYNYFQNGGTSLLVTRVASGSFSPATSSQIQSNTGLVSDANALSGSVTQDANVIGSTTLTVTSVASTTNGSGSGAAFDIVFSNSSSWAISTITATSIGSGYSVGDTVTLTSQSLGAIKPNGDDLILTLVANDIQSSGTDAFVLETLSEGTIMNSDSTETSNGSLASGSSNNFRWEILNPNVAKGVFSLIIRKGDDTTKSKSIVETFPNVSLDPKAANYIARIIGDQTFNIRGTGTDVYVQPSGSFRNGSKYVRVKTVNAKTPDYFDNDGIAKPQYTASIPIAQSGSFGNADGNIIGSGDNFYQNISNTNTQGISGNDYTTAINVLLNKDDYKFNIISTPGLIYSNATHVTPLNLLISNIEERTDAIVVVDLENYDSTVTAATTTAQGIDSSYAASYWPWVQISDPNTAQLVWVPASTLIPGVYAYTDKVSEPWFAPAGTNRGGLSMVIQTERKVTQTNRNDLYTGKVNPLATFPGKGVVAFGQKTLQAKPSALDRINVRRLLIETKGYISQIADTLVFEQNTASTRNSFLSKVNPYLESVQQRQGLYIFKVIMDESNNSNDVIDRNQLIGQIYLQPTRTSEFIYLDFNILPTGATFPQ